MSLGKRTIYVATDSIGFEVKDLRTFSQVELTDGKVVDEMATYVEITAYVTKTTESEETTDSEDETTETVLTTTKALKLLDKIFIFNTKTNTLDEHEIVDEDMEVVSAIPTEIMTFEKNTYLRKYAFDCTKETDQQNQDYQPINGLITSSSYLTLKTHNFTQAKDEPKAGDILYYQKRWWMIEDTSKTFVYTPREQSILHLSLKAINK